MTRDGETTRNRGSGRGALDEQRLPEQAYAVALASVPGIGPARLRRLLAGDPPSLAWARHRGAVGGRETVARLWRAHTRAGITVLLPAHPSYPDRLRDDPLAPPLLFCLGDPSVLGRRPTVALVGTRSPTRYGIGVAAQLGAELTASGVSVVSGLALGIDGAAHEGACASAGAPPLAVVAGGLDDPYPRRHARLWARVGERGTVVSESPSGVRTEKWRFPVRNRLLAALSDVVVVVESRVGGGSRHTVDAAVARGVPVGAVPGSIRSAASDGTNALLGEGAFPVCSAADVLIALSLAGAPASSSAPPLPERSALPELGADRALYEALTDDPVSLVHLVERTGLDLGRLCSGLERLARAGVARDVGGWWERA